MGPGLRRRPGADSGDARPAAAPLDRGQHPGRKLSAQRQAPRQIVEGTGGGIGVKACPGGSTVTSRAPLRRTRGGRSAPRGSLLWTTWTSPEATEVGQYSTGEIELSGSAFNRR